MKRRVRVKDIGEAVSELLRDELPSHCGYLLLIFPRANDEPDEHSGLAYTTENERTVDALLASYQRTRRSPRDVH
jgi:hypothetical protein